MRFCWAYILLFSVLFLVVSPARAQGAHNFIVEFVNSVHGDMPAEEFLSYFPKEMHDDFYITRKHKSASLGDLVEYAEKGESDGVYLSEDGIQQALERYSRINDWIYEDGALNNKPNVISSGSTVTYEYALNTPITNANLGHILDMNMPGPSNAISDTVMFSCMRKAGNWYLVAISYSGPGF